MNTKITGQVYIAGSLKNSARIQEIQNKFRSVGIEITYDWTTHGFVDNEKLLPEIGRKERDGVLEADVLFLVQPGRLGSHVEFGIAVAMNALGTKIPIIILEEVEMEMKPFYYLDCVTRFKEEQPAFEFALEEIRCKHECIN
jgi:hypothetical protein